MSGSGISWAICKSAPRSRQTTTPVPQWHQLDHMQIMLTSLHTDNQTNTSSVNFLQARCSTNSVSTLKASDSGKLTMNCNIAKHQLIQNWHWRAVLTSLGGRVLSNKKKVVYFLQISERGWLDDVYSNDRAVAQADSQIVSTKFTFLDVAIQLNHRHTHTHAPTVGTVYWQFSQMWVA